MLTPMRRRPTFRVMAALAALLIFIVLPSTVDFLLDWLWFGSVGYRDIYVTRLRAQASLTIVVFGAAFLMLFGNLWIAISSIVTPYIVLGSTSSGGTIQPATVRREQL